MWGISDESERHDEVVLDIFHHLDKPGTCVHGGSFQPHPNPSHYFMEILSIVVTDISKTSLNNYAVEKFNKIMWANINISLYYLAFSFNMYWSSQNLPYTAGQQKFSAVTQTFSPDLPLQKITCSTETPIDVCLRKNCYMHISVKRMGFTIMNNRKRHRDRWGISANRISYTDCFCKGTICSTSLIYWLLYDLISATL